MRASLAASQSSCAQHGGICGDMRAGPWQGPDLLAHRVDTIINREREFLGNEAPYGPLLVEHFNIL